MLEHLQVLKAGVAGKSTDRDFCQVMLCHILRTFQISDNISCSNVLPSIKSVILKSLGMIITFLDDSAVTFLSEWHLIVANYDRI